MIRIGVCVAASTSAPRGQHAMCAYTWAKRCAYFAAAIPACCKRQSLMCLMALQLHYSDCAATATASANGCMRKTLVCPYASSQVLAVAKIHQRLRVPSIVQIVHHINSSPVFIHSSTEPEPTARARRAGEEFY